jgi:hypothetical protein
MILIFKGGTRVFAEDGREAIFDPEFTIIKDRMVEVQEPLSDGSILVRQIYTREKLPEDFIIKQE